MACRLSPTVILAVCLAGGAASDRAVAQTVALDPSPGKLLARLPDGTPLWTLERPEARVPTWHPLTGGRLALDDGRVLSATGALLYRVEHGRIGDAGGSTDASAPGVTGFDGRLDIGKWTPPFQLLPAASPDMADSAVPPVFDGQGNAWVLNSHYVETPIGVPDEYSLQVRRSIGHTGAWAPLQTLSDSTRNISDQSGAFDPNDVFTVLFRNVDGAYELYALRHVPGQGWGPLTLVVDSPTFFQAIEIAADDVGNVIGVIDIGQPFDASLWGLVQDGTSWGQAEQIVPVGQDIRVPTLVTNADGSLVMLGYEIQNQGLYTRVWESSTRSWGDAQAVPGTTTIDNGVILSTTTLRMAIGGDDEATLVWQDDQGDGTWIIKAARTLGGTWQAPVDLAPPSPQFTGFGSFAHVSAAPNGDVLAAMPRYDGTDDNNVYAFRYDASGTGWQTPKIVHTNDLIITTRVRSGWSRNDRAALAFHGVQDDLAQLTSARFGGQGWSGLLDVPGDLYSFQTKMGNDGGELLLVFESGFVSTSEGNWATWLRELALPPPTPHGGAPPGSGPADTPPPPPPPGPWADTPEADSRLFSRHDPRKRLPVRTWGSHGCTMHRHTGRSARGTGTHRTTSWTRRTP